MKQRITDYFQILELMSTGLDTPQKLLVTCQLRCSKKKKNSITAKAHRLEAGTDPKCRMQQTNVGCQRTKDVVLSNSQYSLCYQIFNRYIKLATITIFPKRKEKKILFSPFSFNNVPPFHCNLIEQKDESRIYNKLTTYRAPEALH